MIASTDNFPNIGTFRQLLHLLDLKAVSRVTLINLLPAQLPLPASSHHQQPTGRSDHRSMPSSTTDLDNPLLQVVYFPGKLLIRLVSMAKLPLITVPPGVHFTLFGDCASVIVPTTDIDNLLLHEVIKLEGLVLVT